MHPQASSLVARRSLPILAILGLAAGSLQPLAQTPAPSPIPSGSRAAQATSRNVPPVKTPAAVALSPDGKLIAWTMRGHEAAGLNLSETEHPEVQPRALNIPGGTNCAYTDPVWAHNGDTLAFLGSCATPSADPTVPRQQQIYLWSRSSGQVRPLTQLTGDMQQIAWSPDDQAIAFLFVQNATRTAGALDAMKPWSGVIGEDGVEVQRVYAVNAVSGAGQMLSPATLHVYEFDWAPKNAPADIAYIAAAPPGENNWWVAKLYTQSVRNVLTALKSGTPAVEGRTGEVPEIILDTARVTGALHGLQIAVPRWSPDGKHIAFIGGLMSDQGSTGGDLYTVASKGGQPTDVTPGIDGTPCFEAWLNDRTLGFVEDRRGHTLLVDWDLEKQAPFPQATHDLGEVSVSGGPIKDAVAYAPAGGGTLAFVEQGFRQAPEIWTLGRSGTKQLTHLNDGAVASARTESVEWTSGPFHVQGWLTFPANYDPARQYPILVTVHGGPSASVTARWGSHLWANRGYFELQPNPRGSFGQGEAFTAANREDFGYGDLKDIEAGLDFVETKYPVDHTREGITGWSYGGFMTMFSVTQTHRFRAAVAGAGVSDWLSYYGENSIDQWMIPFFGASVYQDPAVYAKSSAINYIRNVTTPTLVIVGDRDGECPAPQSFEFWHALRDLGVKTQLVIYPDEGHGFRNPEHIRDRDERTAKWFADNMPASPATSASVAGAQ